MQPSYHSPENFGLGKNELPFPRKYVPYNSNQQQTHEEDSNEFGYDDILNALNVRLHEGKLRALSHEEKRNNTRAATIAASPSKSPSYLSRGGAPRAPRVPIRNGLASKQYAPPPKIQPPPARHHENVQNNYIYNKYFKDYAQQGGPPSKPLARALTREEYIVHMKKHAWEQARQYERIRQIKSKKLLFNNGDNTHINITTTSGSWNKMFQLKGVGV
jgi:hypothetical protein